MADLVITASNVLLESGSKVNGTAGAAITAGTVVYKDANGKIQVAHCETSATTAAAVGIALNDANADGAPIDYQVNGDIALGAVLTKGTIYVLSATGAIAPAADLAASDYVTILGIAKDTNSLTLGIQASGVTV